jgi:uncharacterized Zn-finger protein
MSSQQNEKQPNNLSSQQTNVKSVEPISQTTNKVPTTSNKPRKYKCTHPGCNKAYTNSSHLKRHQRLHSDSRPEVCPICSERFAKKSNLRKHISRVHAKDPNMKEASQEALNAIKDCTPHICTWEGCGKQFCTQGKLKAHMKKHEGMNYTLSYE